MFFSSLIAATNFYDSGGSLGEELGEELGEIFCARMTHKSRRPPDYSSNWCPLGGCFGTPSCCFLIQTAQSTP